MNVSFASFPVMPAENNIFYHTGNPDLSSFTCDVSAAYPAGLVDCNITDIKSTNIKGEWGKGSCSVSETGDALHGLRSTLSPRQTPGGPIRV